MFSVQNMNVQTNIVPKVRVILHHMLQAEMLGTILNVWMTICSPILLVNFPKTSDTINTLLQRQNPWP
jgi:hypothetical protein